MDSLIGQSFTISGLHLINYELVLTIGGSAILINHNQ